MIKLRVTDAMSSSDEIDKSELLTKGSETSPLSKTDTILQGLVWIKIITYKIGDNITYLSYRGLFGLFLLCILCLYKYLYKSV